MSEKHSEKDLSWMDFTDLMSLEHSLALKGNSGQEIIILLGEAISHDGYDADVILVDAGLLPELEAIKAAIASEEYPYITEQIISEYLGSLNPMEL
ncbi:MAG: hypothetical protein ABIM99_05405 [Candidatus Dojkabacteria bacterium]